VNVYSFFFSSRRRHTRSKRDWSSDVCSSDLCFNHSFSRVIKTQEIMKICQNKETYPINRSTDFLIPKMMQKKNIFFYHFFLRSLIKTSIIVLLHIVRVRTNSLEGVLRSGRVRNHSTVDQFIS